MITPDRGDKWVGYYRRDNVAVVNRIFGIEWLNAVDCGTYLDSDGTLQGVTCVILYKDEFPDCQGKFAEGFDISLDDADYFCADPLYQAAAAGMPITAEVVESVTWASPSVKWLVLQDVADGLTGMQIFDRRAGVINYRFLGFTFDEMISAHPEMVQPVVGEDGSEIMNLTLCSLEEMDNF